MTPIIDLLQKWVLKYSEAPSYGIPRCRIETLGNSGWSITITTMETDLSDLNFEVVTYWKPDDNVISLRCKDSELEFACDAPYLVEALALIATILSTSHAPNPDSEPTISGDNQSIARLQQWYLSSCDGAWEHEYGLSIQSLPDPGWELNLDLLATSWEGLELEPQSSRNSEQDWLHLRTTERGLQATCGPLGLSSAIDQTLALLTPENMTFPD
jgi:Immunity protein 53